MPVTYEFDGRILNLHMSGVYGTADVRDALFAALGEAGGADVLGMLFDIRGSRSIAGRTADEVRAMAQFLGSQADRFGRRLAMVADTDASFGLMRLGSIGVEQHGVDSQVFRDPSDAALWLKR